MWRGYKAEIWVNSVPYYDLSTVESPGGSCGVRTGFPAPRSDAKHTWGAGRGAFKKQTGLEFPPLLLEIRHIHFVL